MVCRFDYTGLGVVLWFCVFVSLLSLWDVWVEVFNQIWKHFCHYFFKCFFLAPFFLSFPSGLLIIQMLNYFVLPCMSLNWFFSPILFLSASIEIMFMDPASHSLLLSYAVSHLPNKKCLTPLEFSPSRLPAMFLHYLQIHDTKSS